MLLLKPLKQFFVFIAACSSAVRTMADAAILAYSEHRWSEGDAQQYMLEYLPFLAGRHFVVLDNSDTCWIEVAEMIGGRVGWAPRGFMKVFTVPHAALSTMLLPPVGPPPMEEFVGRVPARELPLPPMQPLPIREWHVDGSDGRGGFASAAVEITHARVVEHSGDFRGPVASELVGVQLGLAAVEHAVRHDPPCAYYNISVDNSVVKAWIGENKEVEPKGMRFLPVIEHVRHILARVRQLASPADVIITKVDGEANAAHGLAYGQLSELRDRDWQVREYIDDAELWSALEEAFDMAHWHGEPSR